MSLKCHRNTIVFSFCLVTVALKWTFSFLVIYSSNIASLCKRKAVLKIIVKEHAGINLFYTHTQHTFTFLGKKKKLKLNLVNWIISFRQPQNMIINFLFPQIDVLFSVCWEEKKWGVTFSARVCTWSPSKKPL